MLTASNKFFLASSTSRPQLDTSSSGQYATYMFFSLKTSDVKPIFTIKNKEKEVINTHAYTRKTKV
jgi:hypothetical protein